MQRPLAPLTLVPTPIGNLEDITIRALAVLKEVDTILAEDTRNTGQLLKHYEIKKPLMAHHAHNEHVATKALLDRMSAGERFALVSDAGTPGISDPGFYLVRACHLAGIEVDVLPGASALLPGLLLSGLPADRFVFEGFLPLKKGRKTRLESLANEERTTILYESPHRLLKTLTELAQFCGTDRMASVSRELTKLFQETRTASLGELLTHFSTNAIRGEFVLVVSGKA